MQSVAQVDILSLPGQPYLEFHARRYAYLIDRVDWFLDKRFDAPWKILDIGPSFQTAMLREKYKNATIDTAGFQDHRFPSRPHEAHVELNLNEIQQPALREYDIVLLAK